jgi:hypothetical protein
MSGFSIDWLDLREDADRRARDNRLREQAVEWLAYDASRDHSAVVVDLGSGTGSTLRTLAVPGHMDLLWRLVDHDETLLAEASRRHDSTHRIEACIADLSRIDTLPLAGARLVTASALFDLVSADFIDQLASVLQAQCQQKPVGLYAALNYDGHTRWTPEHPMDESVLTAFNRDQRTDKGFGLALGPDSGRVIENRFTQAGFRVTTASSPWELNGDDQAMVDALIVGIAGAVEEAPGIDAGALRDWVNFRQANSGSGTCTVGHTDVLALPA